MLAELVFVTRLLGLMNGTRAVEAHVDPSVHSVDLMLDGERVDVLRGAPWKTKIDFGSALAPHELIAIARDTEGRELARDAQYVNVPRPQAEIDVLFERGRAEISWQHIGNVMPKKMKVRLGDKLLASTLTRSVKLPPLAPDALNVLAIDLEFEDGATAHRDIVFGGFSEEVPAELTATIVRERAGDKDRARCFRVGGRTVAASEVEKGDIALLVVRNSLPPADQFRRRNMNRARMAEHVFEMPRTSVRFVWPVAQGSGNSDLFMTSETVSATRGLRFLLLNTTGPRALSIRLADAVAVAGTEALREPRRRAVILVLNGEEDQSRYRPEIVRRYLESLGVRLHVWSLAGAVPDSPWGDVLDITTSDRLQEAVRNLQRDLDPLRVAWLPASPYDALHVRTADRCAWEPLAR